MLSQKFVHKTENRSYSKQNTWQDPNQWTGAALVHWSIIIQKFVHALLTQHTKYSESTGCICRGDQSPRRQTAGENVERLHLPKLEEGSHLVNWRVASREGLQPLELDPIFLRAEQPIHAEVAGPTEDPLEIFCTNF